MDGDSQTCHHSSAQKNRMFENERREQYEMTGLKILLLAVGLEISPCIGRLVGRTARQLLQLLVALTEGLSNKDREGDSNISRPTSAIGQQNERYR